MQSKAATVASEFIEKAHNSEFWVDIKQPTVVAINARFAPGNLEQFTEIDMTAPGLLALLGAKGGSVWGTDGGSVGGAAALERGLFTLNVSGVPKRVVNALRKILND